MKLYSESDFLGAAIYFEQIVELDPNNQMARFYLTYCLMVGGKSEKALKHANILCQMDPTNPQYSALRTQLQKGWWSGISVPAQPVQPSGSSETSELQKPTTTEKQEKVSEKTAEKTVASLSSSAISGTPKTGTASRGNSPIDKALEAIDSQEFATAAAILDDLISKDQKNAQALHYRGLVEYQQGKFMDAKKWFEKALAVKGEMFDTLFLLGDSFMKTGNYQEAEKQFSKAVKLKEEPFAMIQLGEAKRSLGKVKEAIDIYEQVLKKDEKITEAKVYLAIALLDKGELNKASDSINQVLSADPQNSFARYVKGKILFKSELFEDAVASVKYAISLAPENQLFRIFLAQVLLKMGKTNEALETAGEIIRKNPQAWEARLVLAEGLLASGDASNAQEHLSQIEGIVQSPEITLMKAKIARKMGENEKAAQLYKLAIAADSSNADNFLELGQILEDLGEDSSAVDVYREVKDKFPDSQAAAVAEVRLKGAMMKLSGKGGLPPSSGGNPGKVEY